MLTPPDFNLQTADLLILFASMISFLALVWASKKLLYMLQISDFAISASIRKKEKERLALRRKDKINNSIFKTSVSKKELERRHRLYELKQLRVKQANQRELTKQQLQREKFKAKKVALEMRENELIKKAKQAELHRKINERGIKEQNRLGSATTPYERKKLDSMNIPF